MDEHRPSKILKREQAWINENEDVKSHSFTTLLEWGILQGARFPKILFTNFDKEGRGGLAIEGLILNP